jgi:hypothetical protein
MDISVVRKRVPGSDGHVCNVKRWEIIAGMREWQ